MKITVKISFSNFRFVPPTVEVPLKSCIFCRTSFNSLKLIFCAVEEASFKLPAKKSRLDDCERECCLFVHQLMVSFVVSSVF